MSFPIMIFFMNLITISSKNLISIWYYMEINTIIFIYFLIKMNNPIKSPLIYFILSFLTTLIMFMSIIISNHNLMKMNLIMETNNMISITIPMAFMLKMGIIPFHSWVYKMSENMEWISLIIMFSLQKIIPIWAIIHFSNMKTMFMMMMVNMIFSPWLPMKMKNSFFLLSTSSIINNIWIILSSVSSTITTMVYSITYFMINSNFIYILKKNNSTIFNYKNPMQIMISMLSLMGFPPTPNFFVKLLTIKNIMLNNSILLLISIMILFMNMMSSIMYIKFMLISILNMKNMFNWKNFKNNKNKLNLMVNFLFPMSFIVLMYM